MQVPENGLQPGQILRAMGWGALAFFSTALALHTFIRDPLLLHADVRSEKLVMMDEWHGKIFSAAFGSSHIHNGFNPRAFDRELTGTPVATRTANFAVEGGSQSEQRVMALRFARQLVPPKRGVDPPQRCLALLEGDAGANFTNDHLVHPRAIDIYDWQTTRLVTHFVSPDMPTMQRMGRVGYALAAFGLHSLNLGMLSNLIFMPPLNDELLEDETTDDRRGQKIAPESGRVGPVLRTIVASWPAQLPVHRGVLTPGSTELVEQIAAASSTPNLSFVYIFYPKLRDGLGVSDYPDHLDVPARGGNLEVPVINLARPDRYPQFYNTSLWHDDAHLDRQGAELVSSMLAKELEQWYVAHGMPRPCGG